MTDPYAPQGGQPPVQAPAGQPAAESPAAPGRQEGWPDQAPGPPVSGAPGSTPYGGAAPPADRGDPVSPAQPGQVSPAQPGQAPVYHAESGAEAAAAAARSGYPSDTGSGPAYPGTGPAHPGGSGIGAAYPADPATGPLQPGDPAVGPGYPGAAARAGDTGGYPATGQPGEPAPGGYARPEPTGAFPTVDPYGRQPVGGPGGWQQHPPSGPVTTGHRRNPMVVFAVVVACVLVLAVAAQTVLLVRTNSKLDDQRKRTAATQAHNDKRLNSLERTVGALEERAKNSLDSAAVAKKVLPSIFQVVAGNYTGSSFVIGRSSDGHSYLLTNDHVVQHLLDSGGKEVKLEREDSTFSATVVQHDRSLDVAVLECDEKFDPLSVVTKPVQSGDPVIVIGAPLGLNDSVTTGVVSSAAREVPGEDGKFIQFDAAINPGNSGGPVMNAKGEVVGIATEKARNAEGIGLAIPISVPCGKYSVCRS